MAGLRTQMASSTPVTVAAGATKSIAMVTAPSNQGVVVLRVGVFPEGTSPTAPHLRVRLKRATTAGTATAKTIAKRDSYRSETVQAVGAENFTAEPTKDTEPLGVSFAVHPQGGYDSGAIYEDIPGGERRVIEVHNPGATDVAVGYMIQMEE